MKYIEAPNEIDSELLSKQPSIFMGGGITNCKDWQSDLASKLTSFDALLINPRRKDFDIKNPKLTDEQIHWEFKYLRKVDILVFYFSEETVCPITLFEYGSALERLANVDYPLTSIVVYCEPNYVRKTDVLIQTNLFTDYMCREQLRCRSNFIYYCDEYDQFVDRVGQEIMYYGITKYAKNS